MAALSSYFGTHTGNLNIYIGPWQVGSGTFQPFTDLDAGFLGSYAVFGQQGTFSIRITLTGDTSKSAGSCRIALNGQTDNAAQYQVNGTKLTFNTTLNPTPIDVYIKENGTQIDGVSGHNFWVGA